MQSFIGTFDSLTLCAVCISLFQNLLLHLLGLFAYFPADISAISVHFNWLIRIFRAPSKLYLRTICWMDNSSSPLEGLISSDIVCSLWLSSGFLSVTVEFLTGSSYLPQYRATSILMPVAMSLVLFLASPLSPWPINFLSAFILLAYSLSFPLSCFLFVILFALQLHIYILPFQVLVPSVNNCSQTFSLLHSRTI